MTWPLLGWFSTRNSTILRKLKAKVKICKAINKLFKTNELDGITVMTSFAKHLNESIDIGDMLKDADLSDINWTKFIGFLIEKAKTVYWKFRLRPLHATKKRYLETSSKQIRNVIKRHFGHEVTQDDIHIAQKFSQEVEHVKTTNNINKVSMFRR